MTPHSLVTRYAHTHTRTHADCSRRRVYARDISRPVRSATGSVGANRSARACGLAAAAAATARRPSAKARAQVAPPQSPPTARARSATGPTACALPGDRVAIGGRRARRTGVSSRENRTPRPAAATPDPLASLTTTASPAKRHGAARARAAAQDADRRRRVVAPHPMRPPRRATSAGPARCRCSGRRRRTTRQSRRRRRACRTSSRRSGARTCSAGESQHETARSAATLRAQVGEKVRSAG